MRKTKSFNHVLDRRNAERGERPTWKPRPLRPGFPGINQHSTMDEIVEQTVQMPDFLHAEAFIAARLKEITALANATGESSKVTSIFQRLPKHMRRRAMSHTVKRVPRSLRDAHKRQLEKNNALKKRKKLRKRYRKRPKNLLLEYNRRQGNNKPAWLETHIWHAKRFRMCSKWNYKIALSSYEKTFRALYRATTSHCLVQDISYYCCIELSGTFYTLIHGFESITSPECGLTVRAKCWVTGNREGNLTLFHANQYPYKVIGKVNFMWKPADDESVRTLWLWCHPSCHQEILEEIRKVFDLNLVTDKPMDEDQKPDVERRKLDLKNIRTSKVPMYSSNSGYVTMFDLKNNLNRIRLTGPMSNAVLTKALHSAEDFDETFIKSKNRSWWTKHDHKNIRETSLQLLKQYLFPSSFPSHIILGCNIVDPRLFLKRVKSKELPEGEDCDHCLSVPSHLTSSAIWQTVVRDEVSSGKYPIAKLNKLRSELSVPGFDEQLLETVNTVIPILLVQRPGIELNYGFGWDIILPANWAMPVWLSLILCGARAGGLRETKTINFESQAEPEMFPDSEAGKAYYADIKEHDENQYFKKPPKKRTNYIKYGFPTPFHHPWELLVNEWSLLESSNPFYVLRNKAELRKLKEYIKDVKLGSQTYSLPANYLNSLIPVTVTMLSKGNLAPFSHICLPNEFDLKQRMRDKRCSGPCERMHPDVNRRSRRILRAKQTKELKRLRRKRTKEKKARLMASPPLKITKRKESPTKTEVEDFLNEMRGLSIPSNVTTVRKHCDREVCGFVVMSGFSFKQSKVIGQGYVVAETLMKLFKLQKKLNNELIILTRSTNSLHYRYCGINVIAD